MAEIQVSASEPRTYGVLVPCLPEQFGEFISKLLGKTQAAAGKFNGHFNIELKDIENFHHLIEQRNIEQNKGKLIQFTTIINFDDGSSVEVETLEALRIYSEVKPLVSVDVTLTWVYLTSFNNAIVPERQQIEVTIDTNFMRRSSIMFSYDEGSFISYRISYTARTWGADIENLLKDHIRSLIIPEHIPLRRFVRRWHSYIMNIIALALYAVFLRAGGFCLGWLSRNKFTGYNELGAMTGVSQTELMVRKLDYMYFAITNISFMYLVAGIILYLIFALIISYVLAMTAVEGIDKQKPSFVLLTRRAEQAKINRLAAYESNWRHFFVTFLVASLAGVVGNIITWMVWG